MGKSQVQLTRGGNHSNFMTTRIQSSSAFFAWLFLKDKKSGKSYICLAILTRDILAYCNYRIVAYTELSNYKRILPFVQQN